MPDIRRPCGYTIHSPIAWGPWLSWSAHSSSFIQSNSSAQSLVVTMETAEEGKCQPKFGLLPVCRSYAQNPGLLTFGRQANRPSRLSVRWLLLSLLLAFSLTDLYPQDIVGQWQGTVQSKPPLRAVLKVLQNKGQLRAYMISVDQDSDYFPVTALTDSNGEVKFEIDMFHVSFDGRMSSDHEQISGTWTEGDESVKLDLHRATPETSWLTKSTVRMVTVAPNISLEVIDWGGDGPPLVFLAGLGNTAHIFDTLLRSSFPSTMCSESPDVVSVCRVLPLPLRSISAQIS